MKVVCYFSGWFDVSPKTMVTNLDNDVTQTLEQELESNPTLKSVILECFEDASKIATDGEFDELSLTIEEE